MQVYFLLALLIVPSVLGSVRGSGCSLPSGVQVGQNCLCTSGFGGSQCSALTTGACTPATVAANVTAPILGELTGQAVSNNYFSFNVESPYTTGRYFTDISIYGNTTCGYPALFDEGNHGFVVTLCSDAYYFNFSVADLEPCGFTSSETATGVLLSGGIQATAIDSLGAFRGVNLYRTTTSILNIDINIPEVINVNTSEPITVYSEVSPQFAVTQQVYSPTAVSGKPGFIITLTSVVQWPYTLTDVTVDGQYYDGSNIAPVTSAQGTCSAASGNCFQDTTITIDQPACVGAQPNGAVSGSYAFTYQVQCRGGLDCDGLSPVTTSIILNTDNPCATVTVTSGLSGDLSSDTYVYVAGETISFTATFTADVTIQGIALANLYIVQQGQDPQYLWQSYENPNQYLYDGVNAGTGNTGYELGTTFDFSFLADVGNGDNHLFNTDGGDDTTFEFETYAQFAITYRTTFGGTKRNVEHKTLTLKARAAIDASRSVNHAVQGEVNSASKATLTGAAMMAIPLIIGAANNF